MAFNPNDHLSKVQKPNDYLQVKWRLVWFRDERSHGKITTDMVHLDIEKQVAVFKATVEDSEGGVSDGYGSESAKDFRDYIEKAETKAIGRALAGLGYGTQFAPELDEGERIVDSPVDRSSKQESPGQSEQVRDLADKAVKRAKALGITTKEAWDSFLMEVLKDRKPLNQLTIGDIGRINVELTKREKTKTA